MPFISRTERQTDYNLIPPSCPIVIDNGASYFRIGWAGESEPRIVFRNIVQRPRHKITGETVTIVGDHDPALLKYFDCTRSGPRSAFDNDVVFQFEIMEYILDFAFDRLGADEAPINHPILITECACNPVHSRSKMAELLFETYGVPSIAFGVDAAFSYKYNQKLGICDRDGLAICSGFTTSHVIPFFNGEPVYEACCRTNVGGYHVTDYLKQLLSLKYPHHMQRLTWEKVEDLKMEHCYITLDYASEVRLFQKGAKEAEEKTRCWQLPWTPTPVEEPPSEEELARKAALKERQGQRLREMAEAKRSSKINELENELKGLEFLIQQLRQVNGNDIPSFLAETGYVSKQEIESAIVKVTQSLRKAKGEQEEVEEKPEISNSEKYTLIDIPDNMLTPDQVKEKKRQLFLKTTSEGRQKAKQKRFEEELERERRNKEDEQRRLENPELYMEQLRVKYKELSEKVEQRKRQKTNGNGNENNNVSGGVGRGERLNAAQKERMRLLTTAAFDRGKGEDTFGIKDEDWQLYKKMSKDNDDEDEGPNEDETELARVSSKLREIDPTFFPKPDASSSGTEPPRFRPLTKEDFQILIGVERFRCPEILFNPNLIGIEQAGLDEMVGVSIQRLQSRSQRLEEGNGLTNSILITGGSCLYPGMSERLEAGIRMIRPCGTAIRVLRASDAVLDAWIGAASFASTMHFQRQVFNKNDYYEKGEDWLRRYQLKYTF
ncbi:putative Actin family, ATPase, nucleotide binding domain-containing protein [Helianthus annuus]|nr:putative Actin family, ATPase, nucleotide binding domain-containing protein [Helianthus annuus]KAJ0541895.1 putative Actin family, ATPase, nucleotide binding domain-containing protein [Helianthus annuus]KAJ0887604.1 putative Actin family, ATPase, nucleotide binding domain-containing protein [Helianthus annuus]KAJ0892566.1 putative Actin family [Helianthus annuus]